MSLFPMFLKLEDRECLVVGAGAIGEPKIRSLLVAGAKVRVVAIEARPAVAEWARLGIIAWDARSFDPKDVEGAVLVVATTSLREVNEAVFQAARSRGFSATPSTTRIVAISTMGPWSVEGICKWRSRPQARARL